MNVIFTSPGNLLWLALIIPIIGLVSWQRKRLRLSVLGLASVFLLILSFVNPVVLVTRSGHDGLVFNATVQRPRVLLAEYGNAQTLLGTALQDTVTTRLVSPDDLTTVSDLAGYDVVVIHAAKNMRVYSDYFSDWQTFPNRKKLESMFTAYGVVFDNATQSLPKDLSRYGLVVLIGSDIRPDDVPSLEEYVSKGGRLLVLLHAAGGLAVNPPGTTNPYCIVYHHPPWGDAPFPEEWLQRNTAAWLKGSLGVRSMENISCTYGKVVVEKSSLSALTSLYGQGGLYPSSAVDGKGYENLDWTTAFTGYDPAWQPLLRIDTRYAAEPTGHGTPVGSSVNGKAVAIARQYGQGRIYLFGLGPVNYGLTGLPPSLFLTAAPYLGADVAFDENTMLALRDYVANGGNLVVVGPTLPKSTGTNDLIDILPVRLDGPQIAEISEARIRFAHPVVAGLTDFPASNYRKAAAKVGSEVLIYDTSFNPLLVTGFWERGRVVYYLPELPQEATIKNTAPPEMWQRLILWLSPTRVDFPRATGNLTVAGGNPVMTLRLRDENGDPVTGAAVSCSYTAGGGTAGIVDMNETSHGVYSGRLGLKGGMDNGIALAVKYGNTSGSSLYSLSTSVKPALGIPDALWRAFAFSAGSPGTEVVPAPVWQLFVLLGTVCFVCDWVRRLLKGHW